MVRAPDEPGDPRPEEIEREREALRSCALMFLTLTCPYSNRPTLRDRRRRVSAYCCES